MKSFREKAKEKLKEYIDPNIVSKIEKGTYNSAEDGGSREIYLYCKLNDLKESESKNTSDHLHYLRQLFEIELKNQKFEAKRFFFRKAIK